MCIWTRHFFILNAWGVLLEFLGGGELIGSQVLTLFQTKTCHFPHPFSGPGGGLPYETDGDARRKF